MDFWGKVVPGLQGANLRTVHGRTCSHIARRATEFTLQSAGERAAMWTMALLGFGCTVERHL